MRPRHSNRTLLALVICASLAFAEEPIDTTYDTAITALEVSINGYFYAVLRESVGASDSQLAELGRALEDKVHGEFSTADLNFLTPREQIIQIKMIVLRQLHPEFANDALPSDVAMAFNGWETTRPDAVDTLFARGEL